MKNSFIALATGFLSVVVFINSAGAQGCNNVIEFTDTKTFMNSVQTLVVYDNLANINPANASKMSSKAIRDFRSRLGNVTNEKWFAKPDGFVTYFTLNGFKGRAIYNKKGRCQFTMKCYSEAQLPREIRAIVKSAYFDCTITIVEELESADNLVYIVHLEDQKTIKNLRVSKDGAMDLMEEFQKG